MNLLEKSDEELLEIAVAEAEEGYEGPQTKQDLEVIAILSAVNTAVTVMVLGFLYIIGRSRSGATLALKMMYPIETWNSSQPTADFVRLLAVTLAAGIMAMPIMKIVGKGMLRLHAAIPLQSMVMGVIIFVTALVWLSTGFVGIGVLIVGTILYGLITANSPTGDSSGEGIDVSSGLGGMWWMMFIFSVGYACYIYRTKIMNMYQNFMSDEPEASND